MFNPLSTSTVRGKRMHSPPRNVRTKPKHQTQAENGLCEHSHHQTLFTGPEVMIELESFFTHLYFIFQKNATDSTFKLFEEFDLLMALSEKAGNLNVASSSRDEKCPYQIQQLFSKSFVEIFYLKPKW